MTYFQSVRTQTKPNFILSNRKQELNKEGFKEFQSRVLETVQLGNGTAFAVFLSLSLLEGNNVSQLAFILFQVVDWDLQASSKFYI